MPARLPNASEYEELLTASNQSPERLPESPEAAATRPLVSVVIPAYNCEDTIARALDSVWTQTYRSFELVIVDDCSTDGTGAALADHARRGARVITLPNNVGAAEARNIGVREARGTLVAFLDSDDEWGPTKLERQVDAMRADPQCVLVSSDCTLVSAGGDAARFHTTSPPTAGKEAWKALLAKNYIATPTVLTWRKHLLSNGGFDPKVVVGEDLDVWIKIALLGPIAVVPEALATVYWMPESLLRQNPDGDRKWVLPMIHRHLERLNGRLSRADVRHILGVRYFEVGYSLYRCGQRGLALPFFCGALIRRYRVLKCLTFFPRAILRATLEALGLGSPRSA